MTAIRMRRPEATFPPVCIQQMSKSVHHAVARETTSVTCSAWLGPSASLHLGVKRARRSLLRANAIANAVPSVTRGKTRWNADGHCSGARQGPRCGTTCGQPSISIRSFFPHEKRANTSLSTTYGISRSAQGLGNRLPKDRAVARRRKLLSTLRFLLKFSTHV